MQGSAAQTALHGPSRYSDSRARAVRLGAISLRPHPSQSTAGGHRGLGAAAVEHLMFEHDDAQGRQLPVRAALPAYCGVQHSSCPLFHAFPFRNSHTSACPPLTIMARNFGPCTSFIVSRARSDQILITCHVAANTCWLMGMGFDLSASAAGLLPRLSCELVVHLKVEPQLRSDSIAVPFTFE